MFYSTLQPVCIQQLFSIIKPVYVWNIASKLICWYYGVVCAITHYFENLLSSFKSWHYSTFYTLQLLAVWQGSDYE